MIGKWTAVTYTKEIPVRKNELALSPWFDLTVAIITVHRSILAGFEGYLGLFAALGTYRGKHLTRRSRAGTTIAVAVASAGLTAGGTALGLIGVALTPAPPR